MRTMTLLVALASLMWPAMATGQEARLRTIALRPVEATNLSPDLAVMLPGLVRSEERRVGKECRL